MPRGKNHGSKRAIPRHSTQSRDAASRQERSIEKTDRQAGKAEIASQVPAAACPRCGGWTSFGGMSQYSKSVVEVLGRKGCICYVGATPLKEYVWGWSTGGYNTCMASNKEDATLKAEAMCKGCPALGKPVNVRLAKKGEIAALDRHYAGMFD